MKKKKEIDRQHHNDVNVSEIEVIDVFFFWVGSNELEMNWKIIYREVFSLEQIFQFGVLDE